MKKKMHGEAPALGEKRASRIFLLWITFLSVRNRDRQWLLSDHPAGVKQRQPVLFPGSGMFPPVR